MLSIIFMIVARIKHCKRFFLLSADNFHDHFTYLTLWAVFLFLADVGNATVLTNSKQVSLRHSHSVNMFYFTGLSFQDTQRVWVFRVRVFETPRGSEFSTHPRVWGFETPEGLSFRDTQGSEFFGSGVWAFEVWVFETPLKQPPLIGSH